ncbi:ammonia-forming cytochrome c nitrite reductase subunit c552 [Simiduia sp. 21SJ11W-1]|uniref:ammonia-forming cytochrome c nitrite reductase subunit c552 n=1 Tax=Simiduia sp. 21SJ11W-1 TaxID=2909669 RepID=UPI00209E9CFE|nr:ammonia-forming cytochrome c nitrite reductase subunit c552 [Simiduia sp. 21SJ11W-1]UTA46927.1 ammonia-forming cytochrome c nitrite reductase subunit c552 [Simiduia sp. 21SJ11W-1]
MTQYNFKFWHYGLVITAVLTGLLGYNLLAGDKTFYISGPPTHGHHQIELACTSCHGDPFDERTVMQNACESCHLKALEKKSDTHPKAKFTDPRNAELLQHLDATQCVTCHREHKPEITRDYGVTLAKDFCAHCHQDIATERENHADFGFETCSNSGCHNYHDNTALYENFLRKHVKDPELKKRASVPALTGMERWLKANKHPQPLTAADQDAPNATEAHIMQWAASHHAQAQVNCTDCHGTEHWQDKGLDVSISSCQSCHKKQTEGFFNGKHGMRLNPMLGDQFGPMSPALATLPMDADAKHKTLTCASCHAPHEPDLTHAATEACLGCHKDEHSVNFKNSSHGKLWHGVTLGEVKQEDAVSCATCHMPRVKKGRKVHVEHNQSETLQPNSKMIRSVCTQCHGVEFTLSALADESLIQSNFSSKPANHHTSMDLVRERIEQRKKK